MDAIRKKNAIDVLRELDTCKTGIDEEAFLSDPSTAPPLPRGVVTNAVDDKDDCDEAGCLGPRGCQR